MVGTWQNGELITFAVCHGHRSAVVLDLADQVYDRIVVTVETPTKSRQAEVPMSSRPLALGTVPDRLEVTGTAVSDRAVNRGR